MKNEIIRQSPTHIFRMVEHHCANTTKTVWHLDDVKFTELFPIHSRKKHFLGIIWILIFYYHLIGIDELASWLDPRFLLVICRCPDENKILFFHISVAFEKSSPIKDPSCWDQKSLGTCWSSLPASDGWNRLHLSTFQQGEDCPKWSHSW